MVKFIALILIVSFTAVGLRAGATSSEEYQLKNVVGDWKTYDWPYEFEDISITVSPDQKSISMITCDPTELEKSNQCVRMYDYSASGSYDVKSDTIQMTEGPKSPNPKFIMQVDKVNPNKLLRTWGPKTVKYFRLK